MGVSCEDTTTDGTRRSANESGLSLFCEGGTEVRVQIKPCFDEDRVVVWCEEANAAYFGVYLGEPGDYHWVADFANKDEAQWYAEALCDRLELDQEDFT
jgi:hypothetical protein